MKRLVALFLIAAIALTLAACGEKSSNRAEDGSFIFQNESSVALEQPSAPLNPQSIYSSLTYTPEMFYGHYSIVGGDAAEQSYAQEMDYIDYALDLTEKLTAIPYAFEAGPDTLSHVIGFDKSHNWLRAYYYTESGNLTFFFCSYTIDGNTISLQPIDNDSYDYNKETCRLSYRLREEIFTYQFSFSGLDLTLSQNGKSVTLRGSYHTDETESVSASCYLRAGSPACDIDYLSFLSSPDYSNFHIDSADGTTVYNAIGQMSNNGLFTCTVPWESGTKTYQYVYFYGGNDGMILTDGANTYYFTDSKSDRNGTQLGSNYSYEDMALLDNINQDEIQQIAQKRADLLSDLAKAYQDAGLNVTVDQQTGEIRLDSGVLFAVDQAQISDQGKSFLQQFIKIYTDIVFNDQYNGFISKILVEGHTDTSGDYDHNLTLSQQRADNVLSYCLSAECDVAAYTQQLTDMMVAQGYSWDQPIYDGQGNVDMDASRRVTFRFLIKLGS